MAIHIVCLVGPVTLKVTGTLLVFASVPVCSSWSDLHPLNKY